MGAGLKHSLSFPGCVLRSAPTGVLQGNVRFSSRCQCFSRWTPPSVKRFLKGKDRFGDSCWNQINSAAAFSPRSMLADVCARLGPDVAWGYGNRIGEHRKAGKDRGNDLLLKHAQTLFKYRSSLYAIGVSFSEPGARRHCNKCKPVFRSVLWQTKSIEIGLNTKLPGEYHEIYIESLFLKSWCS